MEFHRAQVKLAAKAAMKETHPRAWVVTLVYLLIGWAISFVSGLLSSGGIFGDIGEMMELIQMADAGFVSEEQLARILLEQTGGGFGLGFFISILVSLVTMVLGYGYYGYCLKVYRRQPASYGVLFSAFPNAFRVIGTCFMVAIFTFLWSLAIIVPGTLVMLLITVLMHEVVGVAVLLVMVLYIAMLVGVVAISLRYAMAPYIMMENPQTGVFEAITRSKQLMVGNKGKLFVLQLSFIGWELLLALIILVIVHIGVFISAAVMLNGGYAAGMVVFFLFIGIAFIASLPMSLWLNAYVGVSQAGFYHAVSFVPAAPVNMGQPPVNYPPYNPNPSGPSNPTPVNPDPVPPTPVNPDPVIPTPVEPQAPAAPTETGYSYRLEDEKDDTPLDLPPTEE